MVGLGLIAVRILTIAPMRLASMVLHALMVSRVSIVVVPLEKLVYCVIWMMLVHQILAMLMPFVTLVQSMDHTLAPVQPDTKELTAQRISTNVHKDRHANIMEFALIPQDLLLATVLNDSRDHGAKLM